MPSMIPLAEYLKYQYEAGEHGEGGQHQEGGRGLPQRQRPRLRARAGGHGAREPRADGLHMAALQEAEETGNIHVCL